MASLGAAILISVVACAVGAFVWQKVTERDDYYDQWREALRNERTREKMIELLIARHKVQMLTLLWLTILCAVFITFHFAA